MAQSGSAASRPPGVKQRKPRFRERNTQASPAGQPVPDQRLPQQSTQAVAPHPKSTVASLPVPRLLAFPVPALSVEQGLYAALLLAGFALRIWDVGSRAMHGDESIHAWLSWNLYSGAGYQYDPVYHGPLQFLVTAAFFFLFGDSSTTARLMAVLFGTVLVILPYFLRHWMGRGGALVAAIFLAFSPAVVYVSRLERDDIFTAVFALLMAIALFQFVRTLQVRYLYLGATSIALSLSAMENTYITLFVFGSFVLIVLLSERLAALDPVGRSLEPAGRSLEPAGRSLEPAGRSLKPAGRSRFGERLLDLWRRTGTRGEVATGPLVAVAALFVLAFGLTVLTGLYLPVPLVAAITLILLVNRQTMLRVADDGQAPFLRAVRSVTRTQWINAITVMLAILFLTFSTMGSNPKGIWDASQPFFNTPGACPGNSFPLNPCRKDIVGGLFYWLSQHQVHRGGQPWFYYSLLFGLYQQIAVIFGIGGIIWTLRRPTFFRTFLAYWAVAMFGVYSWAGEKFPWLMIHPLLPFTLIAAMFAVHALQRRGTVRVVAIAALAILGLLELHTTYVLNFIDGADPVEMMVYVQSAPDTSQVANNILTTSYKATSGNSLHVSIDSVDTWPFAWYLRHMPNVGYPGPTQLLQKPFATDPIIIVDAGHQPSLAPLLGKRYTGHEYRLRWWFPEDYKTLSWSSFSRDLVNPGYWNVVGQWLVERRPFGPRQAMWFYYYVKKGLISPY